MIGATRLEFRRSREKILSLYVSHVPFGGNVVGLDAAARRYFGHSAEGLSWTEPAILAVLPNSPAMIRLSKSRQASLDKRNRLLTRLHQKGILDTSTYELAIDEPLPQEPLPLPQIAPHLTNHFYQTRDREYSVSTIDRDIQTQIESLVERRNSEFRRSDIRNMVILVIDIHTNQAVAYCGNVHFDKKKSGNQVDAIRSPRSTGSILRPFLYYTMLREGETLPNTLLPDVPVNINGFTPQSFSQQFEDAVPTSETITRSLDVPSVIMLQRYGVPKFHDFPKQIGLTTLNRPSGRYGLSLILGGAEAILWNVTSAYANVGRSLSGLVQAPCTLLLSNPLSTHRSPTIIQHPPFQPGVVWQTFDAIREANRPKEIDQHTIPSIQTIAWKTDINYGFRGAWAVEVTPKYTAGVWVGDAMGEGKPGLIGARTAGPILFDVFSLLPFSPWSGRPQGKLIEAEICRQSGRLKGRFYEETDTLLVLSEGLRTEACPYHHPVTLSADKRSCIYENCADSEPIVHRNWFTLPPVREWYYKWRHPEYHPLPPFKSGYGEDRFQPIQFIYPPMGTRIHLPKQMDGSQGQLAVELVHGHPNTTVYWHPDETYLMQTQDFHKFSLRPVPGKHSLTAVDDEGNTISATFFVEQPPKWQFCAMKQILKGNGGLPASILWTFAIVASISVADLYYNQPLLNMVRHELGVLEFKTSLIVMVTQIGYALGLLFIVPLGDLHQRRRIVLTGFSVLILSLLAIAMAPDVHIILYASLLTGICSVMPQIFIPIASQSSRPENKERNVGIVVSGLLAGILASRVINGFVRELFGWYEIYYIAAGMMLSCGIVAMRVLPGVRPNFRGRYSGLMKSLYLLLKQYSELRIFSARAALVFGSFLATWSCLAFKMGGAPFYADSHVIGVLGLCGIAGALSASLVGKYIRRVGVRRSNFIGCGLILLVWFLLFAGENSYWGIVAGIIIIDVGMQCIQLSNQTRIFELYPSASNRINTISMTTYSIGASTGASLTGTFWQTFGWHEVIGAGIALTIGSLLITFFPKRQPEIA